MTEAGVTVRLTWYEVWETANCGAARYMLAAQADREQRYGEVAANRWATDIEGALGERVLAKFMGWYWDGALRQEARPGDVRDLEARQSIYPRAKLCIHPGDADDTIFVLITGAIDGSSPYPVPGGGLDPGRARQAGGVVGRCEARARAARPSGCRSTCCIRRRRCGSTRPRSCAPGRRPQRGRHERPAGADPSPPGLVYGGDEAVRSLPRHRAAARGSGAGDPAAGRSPGEGRLSVPPLSPQLGLLRQPLPDLRATAGDAGEGGTMSVTDRPRCEACGAVLALNPGTLCRPCLREEAGPGRDPGLCPGSDRERRRPLDRAGGWAHHWAAERHGRVRVGRDRAVRGWTRPIPN